MKKRTLILVCALVLVATTALAGRQAWAQVSDFQTALQVEQAFVSGFPGRAQGPQRLLQRLGRYLELTEAQKAQIKTILETERPKVQPLVMQAVASHKAITGATADGQFNEAQVRLLAAQQGQNVAALIVEKERVKTQLYQVLTPAQREKLDALRERFETRIREHLLEHQGQ